MSWSTVTLAYALAYTEEGIPVLPLHAPTPEGCSCGPGCSSPGKHPRTAHGLHGASTAPAVIRTWFERWPSANLGARTGTAGGIFAVDVDSLEAELQLVRLAGAGSKALLEPNLLGGLLVETARGRHHWFCIPDGVGIASSAGRLAPGIDVRGEGGYIVAPPSLHRSGRRYRFAGGRLEPPPAWLLAELLRDEPAPWSTHLPAGRLELLAGGPTTRYGRGVLERRCARLLAAPEGERNYTLLRAATTCAGYAASGEIDLDDARDALTAAALAAGLGERETARTIASGIRRGFAKPLRRPPSWIEQMRGAALVGPLAEAR